MSVSASSSPKIGFVSLGCPKALVDSERILTQLRAEGYAVVGAYDAADLVVVNTCGFIDSAVEESLEAIGEALSENGKVIVTGCLGAREGLIRDRFPDLLAITGPQDYAGVMRAVHAQLPPRQDPFVDLLPPGGIKLTPRHYAYLKIAEGCNHRCSFCIIPSMRGRLVSRPVTEVLREAEALVRAGVRELLVISQDTSAYGADLAYAGGEWRGRTRRTHVQDLCEALGELGVWIRLHYVYPYPHVDALVPLMAEGKILPYLDIPFQHASPSVLKRMRRPAAAENTLRRLERWRSLCPEITVRSTFIVGFPGETEADFELLIDWLKQAQLDRVGCFTYSPVDGAAANALSDPVAPEVQRERYDRFMRVQARISRQKLKAKIGRRIEILIDECKDGRALGRSHADAPEIDGQVVVPEAGSLKIGERVVVEVIAADTHDLTGRLVTG